MCFRLLDGTWFVVTLYHKHSRNNRTYFLDYATFGAVDANGWTDFGSFFLKSISYTSTADIPAYSNSSAANLSGTFGVPVNGLTPTLDNTTLHDTMTVDGSWSAMCMMVRLVAPFNVVYANARNGSSKIGTRRITAIVYGRKL